MWGHAGHDAHLPGRSLPADARSRRARSGSGRRAAARAYARRGRPLDGEAPAGAAVPRQPHLGELGAPDHALEVEGAREGKGLRVEEGGGRVEERGGGGGDLFFCCARDGEEGKKK